jgi:hypothetical protein
LNKRAFLILGLYVALSTAFCWPLFAQPFANGHGDWDQHIFYYASVLRNAAFGGLPFWNPYYTGGDVLWANPQASLVGPIYLLALVMPLTLAMKLNVLGHYVVGCVGMHLIARRLVGVRSLAITVFLVSLFVFAGGLTLHIRAGHTVYLPVFLLPLIIYCFWRATEGHTRFLWLGAVLVALMVLNGGTHALPLAVVMLGALGLGAVVFGRTVKPLALAVAMVVLGCAYAAPRVVPAMLFIKGADFHDVRPVKEPDYMSWEMLRIAFFDGSQDTRVKVSPGVQVYGWHEYGNYMGWFGGALALASAVWIFLFCWRREHWRESSAALALVVVVLLTAGEFASYAPARLMRDLPLISSFRAPSRYTMLVPLAGALCAAFTLSLVERVAARPWRRLAEIVCIVGVVQIVVVNRAHFRDVFVLDVPAQSRLFEPTPPTVVQQELVTPGGPWVHRTFLLDSLLAGAAPLYAYEPLQLNRVARLGPVAISGDGDVSISEPTFSPNRVTAKVTVGREPLRVVLNQNFADGWSSNAGTVEHDPASGRPSVALPAGYSGTVVFTFFPPGLWMGVAICLVAIALTALLQRGVFRL